MCAWLLCFSCLDHVGVLLQDAESGGAGRVSVFVRRRVLDFQLQPTAPWRRVSSAQAKAKREKFVGPTSNLAIGDDELDNILDKNVQEERMEDP